VKMGLSERFTNFMRSEMETLSLEQKEREEMGKRKEKPFRPPPHKDSEEEQEGEEEEQEEDEDEPVDLVGGAGGGGRVGGGGGDDPSESSDDDDDDGSDSEKGKLQKRRVSKKETPGHKSPKREHHEQIIRYIIEKPDSSDAPASDPWKYSGVAVTAWGRAEVQTRVGSRYTTNKARTRRGRRRGLGGDQDEDEDSTRAWTGSRLGGEPNS
jgi:hypothetical protein